MYERPRIEHLNNPVDVFSQRVSPPLLNKSNLDQRTRRMLELIDANCGAVACGLHLIRKALALNIGDPHTCRVFKASTGIGIRQYAKTKRFQCALERLGCTHDAVKVIAHDLGYQSVSNFTRRFRQIFQVTPTEFRRIYRECSGSVASDAAQQGTALATEGTCIQTSGAIQKSRRSAA